MKKAWHQNFKRSPKEQRTHSDGTVLATKAELKRYATLRQLESVGAIKNLQRQVRHELILPVVNVPIKTPTGRTAVYTSDFEYDEIRSGMMNHVIEDVKGYNDEKAKFRIAVFEAIYGINVTIVES